MRKLITGDKFVNALVDAGILQEADRIHRVVIDARAGNILKLYVERIGDARLLNVATTLTGVEISEVPAPPVVLYAPTYYQWRDPATRNVYTIDPREVTAVYQADDGVPVVLGEGATASGLPYRVELDEDLT